MSIILYEHARFTGRELPLTQSLDDFRKTSFNDIASSVRVKEGTWKLWEHINYTGRSYQVTPGDYDVQIINEKIGNDLISSVQLIQK